MCQLSNGAVICLECMDRFQLEQNTARINFLLGEVESITGAAVGSIESRIEITKVVQRRPITLNNIRGDHRVVGAINTGQAQAIDVALSYVKENCDPALAELL